MLQAVDDIFTVFDPPIALPCGNIAQKIAEARVVVDDDEPAHRKALGQNSSEVRARSRCRIVVVRHQTADDHARKIVEQRPNRLQDGAADVFEIDVDSVRTSARERRGEIRRAIIDTGIEAEFLNDVAALDRAAGNTDDPAAFDLGDLANQRTDRPGSGRDDHGFAGLRLADIKQVRRMRCGPAYRALRAPSKPGPTPDSAYGVF